MWRQATLILILISFETASGLEAKPNYCRLSLENLLRHRLKLGDLETDFDFSGVKPFDPQIIFPERDLYPNDMRFIFSSNNGVRPHSLDWLPWAQPHLNGNVYLPREFYLSLQYFDSNVGQLRFVSRDENELRPKIEYPNISFNYRGRGIGAFLYLVSARIASDAYNYPLSSQIYQTVEGKALWRRFQENGYTHLVEPKLWAFKPEITRSRFLDPVMKFFLDRAEFRITGY